MVISVLMSKNGGFQIFGLEIPETAVGFERSVEITQDAAVVDDVAEVFTGKLAVHAGDGLQQSVFLQRPVQVEHLSLIHI